MSFLRGAIDGLIDVVFAISFQRCWGSYDEWFEATYPKRTLLGAVLLAAGLMVVVVTFVLGLTWDWAKEKF